MTDNINLINSINQTNIDSIQHQNTSNHMQNNSAILPNYQHIQPMIINDYNNNYNNISSMYSNKTQVQNMNNNYYKINNKKISKPYLTSKQEFLKASNINYINDYTSKDCSQLENVLGNYNLYLDNNNIDSINICLLYIEFSNFFFNQKITNIVSNLIKNVKIDIDKYKNNFSNSKRQDYYELSKRLEYIIQHLIPYELRKNYLINFYESNPSKKLFNLLKYDLNNYYNNEKQRQYLYQIFEIVKYKLDTEEIEQINIYFNKRKNYNPLSNIDTNKMPYNNSHNYSYRKFSYQSPDAQNNQSYEYKNYSNSTNNYNKYINNKNYNTKYNDNLGYKSNYDINYRNNHGYNSFKNSFPSKHNYNNNPSTNQKSKGHRKNSGYNKVLVEVDYSPKNKETEETQEATIEKTETNTDEAVEKTENNNNTNTNEQHEEKLGQNNEQVDVQKEQENIEQNNNEEIKNEELNNLGVGEQAEKKIEEEKKENNKEISSKDLIIEEKENKEINENKIENNIENNIQNNKEEEEQKELDTININEQVKSEQELSPNDENNKKEENLDNDNEDNEDNAINFNSFNGNNLFNTTEDKEIINMNAHSENDIIHINHNLENNEENNIDTKSNEDNNCFILNYIQDNQNIINSSLYNKDKKDIENNNNKNKDSININKEENIEIIEPEKNEDTKDLNFNIHLDSNHNQSYPKYNSDNKIINKNNNHTDIKHNLINSQPQSKQINHNNNIIYNKNLTNQQIQLLNKIIISNTNMLASQLSNPIFQQSQLFNASNLNNTLNNINLINQNMMNNNLYHNNYQNYEAIFSNYLDYNNNLLSEIVNAFQKDNQDKILSILDNKLQHLTKKYEKFKKSYITSENLRLFEEKIILPLYMKNNDDIKIKKEIYSKTYNKYHQIVSKILSAHGLGDTKIEPYGSIINNFMMDCGDIDICLVPIDYNKMNVYNECLDEVKEQIEKKEKCAENVTKEEYTRFSLLKLKDIESGIELDVTVQNMLPILNSKLIRIYSLYEQKFHILGIFLKFWVKKNKIHGNLCKYLSSYALLILIIHYLQSVAEPKLLPILQKIENIPNEYSFFMEGKEYKTNIYYEEDFDKIQNYMDKVNNNKENTSSISELLIGFFDYYAYKYNNQVDNDLNRYKISISKSEREKVDEEENSAFPLEDPFDINYNPGKSLKLNTLQYKLFIYCMKKELNNILNGEYFNPRNTNIK